MPDLAADQDYRRAVELYRDGRGGDAARLCRQALARQPDHAGAATLLGVVSLDGGDATAALPLLRRAAAAGDVRALAALATTWRVLGHPDKAVAAARAAAAAAPLVAEYHYNLGNALDGHGDAAGAEAAYRTALAQDPGLVNAHWNLALLLLRQGRYDEGWREYEWRWRRPGAPVHYHGRFPRWDGGRFDGRTLLLHTEQGFGDAMQFARWLPRVQALGGHVVLECPPPLLRLFAASFPGVELVRHGEPVPPFELQAALPSLPGLFGATPGALPAAAYLHPPPGGPRLEAGGGGLRVGVTRGSSTPSSGRDLPPGALAPLLEMPGVRWHALQFGGERAELAAPGVVDLAGRCADFADTAALIRDLDLVITVDTAIAHLAGGLGRPVWVLLQHRADWRWLEGRGDSPWYPSARLFRQPAPGDWAAVIAEVGDALHRPRTWPPPQGGLAR